MSGYAFSRHFYNSIILSEDVSDLLKEEGMLFAKYIYSIHLRLMNPAFLPSQR